MQQEIVHKLPQLDKRLSLIASMVRVGSIFADIGTDHGYLPAALVRSGICPYGYACDINPLPLKKAERLIREYGLEDSIQTLLTDGLKGLEGKNIQDFIIAGMGGELIASILEDSCKFIQQPSLRFILQPMSRAEHLREYLCTHGFTILKEQAASSGRFTYSVMLVQYTGQINQEDTFFYHVGKMAENLSEESILYLQKVVRRLQKKQRGLEKAVKLSADDDLNKLIDRIKSIIPIKEEI